MHLEELLHIHDGNSQVHLPEEELGSLLFTVFPNIISMMDIFDSTVRFTWI